MARVRYKCLNGEWHEVEPLSIYELTTFQLPQNRNQQRSIHEAIPEELEVGSLGEFIDLALRILAAEPFYLRKDSIPWLMSYVAHLGDLIDDGVIRLSSHWQYELQDYLWRRDSFIYVTRFVGALEFLIGALYTGTTWTGLGKYPDLYRIGGIVSADSAVNPVLSNLSRVRDHFHDKQVKSELTRTRAADSFIEYKVPPGEYLLVESQNGDTKYTSGAVGAGQVERFHLSETWFQYGPAGYSGFEDERACCPSPFQIIHAVNSFDPAPVEGATVIGAGYYGITFYVPHEWITSKPPEP